MGDCTHGYPDQPIVFLLEAVTHSEYIERLTLCLLGKGYQVTVRPA